MFLADQKTEDSRLAIGQKVTAYWNCLGFYYRGLGRIVALDHFRVTVRLLAPVGQNREFQKGDCIDLPRISDQTRWTSRNRVRLREGPKFQHKDYL